MAAKRTMRVGTVEYLDVTVASNVALSVEPVSISIDGGNTWMTAAWTKTGTTAVASVLLGSTNPLPGPGTYDVRIQITSSPEIPILDAGWLVVLK